MYDQKDDRHIEARISQLSERAGVIAIDVPAGTARTAWVERAMLQRLGKSGGGVGGPNSALLDRSWLVGWLAASSVRLVVINRAHLLPTAAVSVLAGLASMLDFDVIMVANRIYCSRALRDELDAWGAERIELARLWERADQEQAP